MILACSIPALLAVILIFMDQQITAVIVNRKENKLMVRKKLQYFRKKIFGLDKCFEQFNGRSLVNIS